MYDISKKTKYAIRALAALSKSYGQKPVLIASLAKDGRIPKKFLELILLELKREGFLDSKKGKGGGYFLKRDPKTINLAELIGALEGARNFSNESSQKEFGKDEEDDCALQSVMWEIKIAMAEILKKETLDDLVRRKEKIEQSMLKAVNFSI